MRREITACSQTVLTRERAPMAKISERKLTALSLRLGAAQCIDSNMTDLLVPPLHGTAVGASEGASSLLQWLRRYGLAVTTYIAATLATIYVVTANPYRRSHCRRDEAPSEAPTAVPWSGGTSRSVMLESMHCAAPRRRDRAVNFRSDIFAICARSLVRTV